MILLVSAPTNGLTVKGASIVKGFAEIFFNPPTYND